MLTGADFILSGCAGGRRRGIPVQPMCVDLSLILYKGLAPDLNGAV